MIEMLFPPSGRGQFCWESDSKNLALIYYDNNQDIRAEGSPPEAQARLLASPDTPPSGQAVPRLWRASLLSTFQCQCLHSHCCAATVFSGLKPAGLLTGAPVCTLAPIAMHLPRGRLSKARVWPGNSLLKTPPWLPVYPTILSHSVLPMNQPLRGPSIHT